MGNGRGGWKERELVRAGGVDRLDQDGVPIRPSPRGVLARADERDAATASFVAPICTISTSVNDA